MPVYNLLSTAIPALQVPGALLDPTSGSPAPTTWSSLNPGANGPGSLSLPFTRNAVRGDALARYGGGIDAVWTGLDLVADAWPNFHLTAGQAGIDGPVTVPGTVPLVATNGTRNWVWLSQLGTVQVVTGSLLPPGGGRWLLLGSFNPSGSVFDAPDYSGRPTLGQGNAMLLQTADAGVPAWTPPGALRFFHLTQDGLYFWSGASWFKLITPGLAGDTAVLTAKNTVRVVTAAALPAYGRAGNVITATSNGALPSVDGVSPLVGDRLLLTFGGGSFGAHADNGVYTVTALGGAGDKFVLTRASDADSSAKVTPGLFLFTGTEGAANANELWLLETAGPITLNTTALNFQNALVAGGASGPAGGDLTGTYPNPAIANSAVTLAKLANIADQTILGNNSGGAAAPIALTPSQVRTLLSLVVGTDVAAQNDSRFTTLTYRAVSGTSDTLVLADAGNGVEFQNGSASTATIPPHSSVAFPVGTVIEINQYGAGQVAITAGVGVTLRSDGGEVKTAAQYATVAIRQRATDEWMLSGDLAA